MLRQRIRLYLRRLRFQLRTLPPMMLLGTALLAVGSFLTVWRLFHLPQPAPRPAVHRKVPVSVKHRSQHKEVTPPAVVKTVAPPTTAAPVLPPASQQAMAPVAGKVILGYGWVLSPTYKDWRYHNGWDYAVAAGTPVRAALGGRVISVGTDALLGTEVALENAGGIETVYAGLTAVRVAVGQVVQEGQVIAQVGTPGLAGSGVGDHLHFEVLRDGVPEDPSNLPGIAAAGVS